MKNEGLNEQGHLCCLIRGDVVFEDHDDSEVDDLIGDHKIVFVDANGQTQILSATENCVNRDLIDSLKDASVVRKYLEERRLSMNILLASNGGSGRVTDLYAHAAHDIQEKGGTIQTFALGNAESAAAEIFALAPADQRHSMDTSSFLWHIGYERGAKAKRSAVESRQRSLRKFFRDEIRDVRLLGEILDKIDMRKDVVFSAEELHRLSLVKNVYESLQSFRERFMLSFGFKEESEYPPVIDAHFAMEEITKAVVKATRVDPRLHVNEHGRIHVHNTLIEKYRIEEVLEERPDLAKFLEFN